MVSLKDVRAERDLVQFVLSDGRIVSLPGYWFPQFATCTDDDISDVQIMPMGVHWPKLDLDVSLKGLLAGQSTRFDRTIEPKRTLKRLSEIADECTSTA